MSDYDINNAKKDIENLQDQNSYDFQEIKRLDGLIKDYDKRVTQAINFNNQINKKIQDDYEEFKKSIINDNLDLGNGENIRIVDNLNSTSTTSALSANQGRVIKSSLDAINTRVDNLDLGNGENIRIVDNLNSTSTTSVLSANQGRVIKSSLDTINTKVDNINTKVDNIIINNGNGGGYGEGLTSTQKQQLQTAYEHSQNDHVTMEEVNEAITNAQLGGGGSTPVTLTEPYDDDIPRIFLSEGILPTTKTSTTMKFEYISKNKRYSGYVDIKCQGTSSLGYPKKNFTIKIYSDKELATKMKINFMNWGNQNKFCLKANYIDISHARNIVSARLWGDIVKTRENYLELPELLRTSPNNGAIDGFFVKIYANGVYQGRYTMNIPKDGWMTNMNNSLDEHCILCGENYQSGLFRARALINKSDWSDELHDKVPVSIVDRWNQVIDFVMSSSDSDFKANIEQYFDLTSLIDYYIFAYVSCGLDSMGKNQIYMTYDGQKWLASMYDMDSTWGLYWNGRYFVSDSYRMQDDYESGANGNQKNLLYLRLEIMFIDEIKARYAVLRNGVLSETNIINRFEEFMTCNSDLIKEDYEIFTNIPSQDTNNIKQIRKYVVDRCKYVDEQIDNLTIPVPCTGITLDKPSLTFTDNTPQTLQVTVEPTNTTDKISYSINPTDIARITDGVVTPLKNGSATITVTCGAISKTCSVDISGIRGHDFTSLELSSIEKGKPFTIYDGALDLNNQTVFADIILDNSSVNQNILSIGIGIDKWQGSDDVRMHCYYPTTFSGSNRVLEINFNGKLLSKVTVNMTNNILKMALNGNGICVNGSKLDIIDEGGNFASLVAQKTGQIGSLEGSNRSKATYNEIRIYNELLSVEELITLTTI